MSEARSRETSKRECTCKWAIADTGTGFYARIVEADPACPVHPPSPGDPGALGR